MSDGDLIALYSARILELTTQIPHLGRLEGAVGQGAARSPQCGSTVSVEVAVRDGQITGFAQNVKACALGQASAAIFGAAIIGQKVADLPALRGQVADMLALGTAPPPAPFAQYEVLRAAQTYKNRHASILLCIDATIKACAAV